MGHARSIGCLALWLGVVACGPPEPAVTTDGGGSAESTGPAQSPTDTGPSADQTGSGSAGCVEGRPGCPCTPQGSCEPGNTCAQGECVPLDDPCGDGVVDPGEACDDGNLDDADGCNADCQPSGSLVWEVDHQPPGDSSCAYAVAIDSADAIGVVGRNPGQTLWVSKLDAEGTTQWSDDSFESGVAKAIAMDAGDRFIVSGDIEAGLWQRFARIYDGDDGMVVATVTPSMENWAGAVAVTAQGEILVAGGPVLRAYDDGPGWTLALEGLALDVAASPRGGFMVAGRVPDGSYDDAWAAWYPGNGAPAWTHTSDDSPYDDRIVGVALDGAGNVLLAGSVVQGGSSDAWLRKLDPDGTPQWTRTYHSGGTLGDAGHGVAVDSHDRIVMVGHAGSLNSESTGDIWIRKYDPEGETLWTVTRAGEGGEGDVAFGVAIDSQDDVVVVGCLGLGGYRHGWIGKYAP